METQMALRNQSKWPQDGYILLRIVGNGGSSQKFGKARPRRSHCDDPAGLHQPPRGPSASGKLVGRILLVASNGVEWWWWLRVASIGVEWWTLVVQRETENDEMEKERMRERSPTNSLHLSRCFESWVLLI